MRREERKRRRIGRKMSLFELTFYPEIENCATEFSPWVKPEMVVLFLVRDSR